MIGKHQIISNMQQVSPKKMLTVNTALSLEYNTIQTLDTPQT
jgi:hypothetical protein